MRRKVAGFKVVTQRSKPQVGNAVIRGDQSRVCIECKTDSNIRQRRIDIRRVLETSADFNLIRTLFDQHRRHRILILWHREVVVGVGPAVSDHFTAFGPANDQIVDKEAFVRVGLRPGIRRKGPVRVGKRCAIVVGQVVVTVTGDGPISDRAARTEVKPQPQIGQSHKVGQINTCLPPVADIVQFLNALPRVTRIGKAAGRFERRQLRVHDRWIDGIAPLVIRCQQVPLALRQISRIRRVRVRHEHKHAGAVPHRAVSRAGDTRRLSVLAVQEVIEVQHRPVGRRLAARGTHQVERIGDQAAVRTARQVVVFADCGVAREVQLCLGIEDTKLATDRVVLQVRRNRVDAIHKRFETKVETVTAVGLGIGPR